MRLISKQQAFKALDSMDDYARMNASIDAHGPRKVLEMYIEQISIKQALKALCNMDNFARMDISVDAHGPRDTMVEFIHQSSRKDAAIRIALKVFYEVPLDYDKLHVAMHELGLTFIKEK